jgi:hypothetical protein
MVSLGCHGNDYIKWEKYITNNNIVQLFILSNEEMNKVDVIKLKIYNIVLLPSVMMATVWVITDYDEIVEPRFAIQT